MREFQWTDDLVKKLIASNRISYADKSTSQYAEDLVEKFKRDNQPILSTLVIEDPTDASIIHQVYVGDTIWVLETTTWTYASYTVSYPETKSTDSQKLFLTEEALKQYMFSHQPVVSREILSKIVTQLTDSAALLYRHSADLFVCKHEAATQAEVNSTLVDTLSKI